MQTLEGDEFSQLGSRIKAIILVVVAPDHDSAHPLWSTNATSRVRENYVRGFNIQRIIQSLARLPLASDLRRVLIADAYYARTRCPRLPQFESIQLLS